MKRFLIVKPSSLGDVIHAFPAVSLLAEREPDAVIDWLVVPAFAPMVAYHPAVDNIIPFRRKELGQVAKFPKAFAELLSGIRRNRYDAVIDLQGLLRSAVISRLAKARIVAGPLHSREWGARIFYRHTLNPGEAERHAVRKNIAMMAEFLGIPEPEDISFDLKSNPVAAQRVATLLRGFAKEKILAVSPGARWVTKEWPPEFFAEVLNLFYRDHHDYSFVILGSPSEKPLGERLRRALKAPSLNLIGLTGIAELVEAIRRSRLLLCNDSGPMHIAAALGTPLTALFGPTDPVLTGPFSDRAEVLTAPLDCVKCFKRECAGSGCHTAISADTVKKSMEKMLGL